MTAWYEVPSIPDAARLGGKRLHLLANGDLRESANKKCWPVQREFEARLTTAFHELGWELVRAHQFSESRGHGFIASQAEGADVFQNIHPEDPVVVAETVWQYSDHILERLLNHQAPILIVCNWSGEWPGLVGALNLRASLTAFEREYAFLWVEDDDWEAAKGKLREWTNTSEIQHDTSHVRDLSSLDSFSVAERELGEKMAAWVRRRGVRMGVFDRWCMGMANAAIPESLLYPLGVSPVYLSQSDLVAETEAVSEADYMAVYRWFLKSGMKFHWGQDPETELTTDQVIKQSAMYVAAVRQVIEHRLDCVGIQYQQGLRRCSPASDLVEAALNNSERPPVLGLDGNPFRDGQPIPHFNEVDMCAGLDGLFTYYLAKAMGQPVENTLHDLRFGSEWEDRFVFDLEISGGAPPAHYRDGWRSAHGYRQPEMYFKLGGSTCSGITEPGPGIWSRVFLEGGELHVDIGRCTVVNLPESEAQRRLDDTTNVWPLAPTHFYGVSRDQAMARHRGNHVQLSLTTSEEMGDKLALAKAAMFHSAGVRVHFCGTNHQGQPLAG